MTRKRKKESTTSAADTLDGRDGLPPAGPSPPDPVHASGSSRTLRPRKPPRPGSYASVSLARRPAPVEDRLERKIKRARLGAHDARLDDSSEAAHSNSEASMGRSHIRTPGNVSDSPPEAASPSPAPAGTPPSSYRFQPSMKRSSLRIPGAVLGHPPDPTTTPNSPAMVLPAPHCTRLWSDLSPDEQEVIRTECQGKMDAVRVEDPKVAALRCSSNHVLFSALGLRYTQNDKEGMDIFLEDPTVSFVINNFKHEMDELAVRQATQATPAVAQSYYELINHSTEISASLTSVFLLTLLHRSMAWPPHHP